MTYGGAVTLKTFCCMNNGSAGQHNIACCSTNIISSPPDFTTPLDAYLWGTLKKGK